MSLYVFLKFLGRSCLPPASMVLGVAVGLGLMFLGYRRVGRGIALLAVLETAILSLAPVADALMKPLQDEARAEAAAAPACCYDAIVVLGGSIAPADPPRYPEPGLVGGSDRLWKAARLYHRGIAPRIIVTGGMWSGEGQAPVSEAAAMKLFLRDLGVPDSAIVEEGKALNTLENIAFVRQIVGDKPVALVTSSYHMPRSIRIARRGGLNASAFPSEWVYAGGNSPWDDYLPSLNSVSISALALWEYMALAFDRRKAPAAP
jgi:uncharacterized SAM-binding protein YcdF (DUF218 family)